MKATLYDALGVQAAASDEEVRAALRRLIRKYYAKTRDGQGNVEEALRFINHASRILGDGSRRAHYDEELALSAGTAEQKIAHVVENAIADSGEQTDVHSAPLPVAPQLEDFLDTTPAGKPPPEATLHHPGLTERVASSVRSPFVAVGLCLLFGGFLVAAIVYVTPPDVMAVAKQVLVWATVALLVLTIVYGLVHGAAYNRARPSNSQLGLQPQTDLAILNWRREKSVFMGASQPAEDASWIFQLRMAELEREKSGRTSEPRPWNRLGARLFDYAIWGLMLALLLSELRGAGAFSAPVAYWLGHPLVAPVLITVTFIPLEALLIAALGTTPGKWLFGVYLQFSISDAYARRDVAAQIRRGLSRSLRVWWKGMGCGIPIVAPVTVALSYERLAHDQETEWDFAEDCLVTHGPPGMLNLATGVLGLAAMVWLYAVAWNQPMADAVNIVRTGVARTVPMLTPLPGNATDRGRIVAAPHSSTTASTTAGVATLPAPASVAAPKPGAPAVGAPIDPDIDALLAERRGRMDALRLEGPRMLRAGNFRRAADLCHDWADLELGSTDAWRCLGDAQQGLGNYKEALAAYRRAKQHDPSDRSLDAAIDRAERGIITDFVSRYRR